MAKLTRKKKQSKPVNPKVYADRVNGYSFATYFVNDLCGDIYGKLDQLTKKELAAVKHYVQSRTRNKALFNYSLMLGIMENADFILQERKQQKNK